MPCFWTKDGIHLNMSEDWADDPATLKFIRENTVPEYVPTPPSRPLSQKEKEILNELRKSLALMRSSSKRLKTDSPEQTE